LRTNKKIKEIYHTPVLVAKMTNKIYERKLAQKRREEGSDTNGRLYKMSHSRS